MSSAFRVLGLTGLLECSGTAVYAFSLDRIWADSDIREFGFSYTVKPGTQIFEIPGMAVYASGLVRDRLESVLREFKLWLEYPCDSYPIVLPVAVLLVLVSVISTSAFAGEISTS